MIEFLISLIKSILIFYGLNLYSDFWLNTTNNGAVESAQTLLPSPSPSALAFASPTPEPTVTRASPIPNKSTPTSISNMATPISTPVNIITNSNLSLLELINAYRKSFGLNDYQTNDTVCNFARVRVQELKINFSHKGFDDRKNGHTLPYPSYSKIAENIANTNSTQKVMDLWKNSTGHNKNILSDATFACTANLDNMYVFESWSP